jgi:hypothetical protein
VFHVQHQIPEKENDDMKATKKRPSPKAPRLSEELWVATYDLVEAAKACASAMKHLRNTSDALHRIGLKIESLESKGIIKAKRGAA